MNIKGKGAIIRKLVAVIPEIVDKHEVGEPIYATCQDDLINQLNPVLQTDVLHARNKEEDRIINDRNIKDETKLDINIEKNENSSKLTEAKKMSNNKK
jgi:hypothetical protein